MRNCGAVASQRLGAVQLDRQFRDYAAQERRGGLLPAQFVLRRRRELPIQFVAAVGEFLHGGRDMVPEPGADPEVVDQVAVLVQDVAAESGLGDELRGGEILRSAPQRRSPR